MNVAAHSPHVGTRKRYPQTAGRSGLKARPYRETDRRFVGQGLQALPNGKAMPRSVGLHRGFRHHRRTVGLPSGSQIVRVLRKADADLRSVVQGAEQPPNGMGVATVCVRFGGHGAPHTGPVRKPPISLRNCKSRNLPVITRSMDQGYGTLRHLLLCRPLLLVTLLTLGSSAPVFAQSVVDRVVGRTPWNQLLELTQLNGQNIGLLALAARVPMGIESNQRPHKAKWSIPATGRTLREVLDALITAEPEYGWEETDGVVLIRRVERANEDRDLLNIQIGRFQLRHARSADAMNAIAALFGVDASTGPGDTRRFSVDTGGDSTLREVLNAIVRAHGTLAWAYQHHQPVDKSPGTILLFIGASGTGVAIPGDARIGRAPPPPVDAVPTGLEPSSILDRVVGERRGQLLSISAFDAPTVAALAEASGTPMGVETAGTTSVRSEIARHTIVTGMRLGDALVALAALDTRYEWREMDGVIVFRPAQAWRDGLNLLFLPVRDVQLQRVTLSTVMGLIASTLKSPEHAMNTIPDTRRISIDMPAGSVLDFLNAAAKAHGQLSWEFGDLSADDRRFFKGRRHILNLWIFGGGGQGLIVP